MKAISFWIFLIFSVFFSVGTSPSVSYLLPPQYSHFLQDSSNIKVKLTESILYGDQTQQKFGISFWLKMYEAKIGGTIFMIIPPNYQKYPADIFVSLSYSLYSQSFNLKWVNPENVYFSDLLLPYTPDSNWIFIGISAGFENKSCLLYYNNLGSEYYVTGFFNFEISIQVNSLLLLGENSEFMKNRIGDFRIHNNIYNEVSEYRSLYFSSCVISSCTSILSSIDYGKCDQWCSSLPEYFFPLFEPSLYSDAPYLTVSDTFYQFMHDSPVFYDINLSVWNDYSITGWFQFQSCSNSGETILMIWNHELNRIELEVALNAYYTDCDKLVAKIYNTDDISESYDAGSITGSSYIWSWYFFAITLNSGSKLLTLYSQNGYYPPSTSFPLISKPIYYSYNASPYNPLYMSIYIGSYNQTISPGNYADFRFYPGNFIDTNLIQYNSNIYIPATYFDPHCLLWSSIWYCNWCEIGYFQKNGLCQKCHYSCADCLSDETDNDCLGCASGYYAQPGQPSMCFDYCPLGYTTDEALNECIGNPGEIISMNFDDNLSGDFDTDILQVQLGCSLNYYPNLDIIDPYPANKRGMYFDYISSITINKTQPGIFVSSDFTIEIWALPFSQVGSVFSASEFVSDNKIQENVFYNQPYRIDFLKFYLADTTLRSVITTKGNNPIEITSPLAKKNAMEWELFSFSLSYDNLSKISQIHFLRNKDYHTESIEGYYREAPNFIYKIGCGSYGDGWRGFMYSFVMYNYAKSYSDIISDLGTCSSCSACPKALNSCLPTCDQSEYVDENGSCQKCSNSCSWICSRADSCNLCYDNLCYKCTKYEIGACTQCIANALLVNGKCKCQDGYVEQNNKCVNDCGDGYYLDLNARKCTTCSSNCLRCNDEDYCKLCKNGLIHKNGKCLCTDGYFIDSSNKCEKCDNSCLTCANISSSCTSCAGSLPILYNSNKCYPCDSFEGYSSYYAIPISYFSDDLFNELSKNCIEICGDGRNMGQLQCDDGNNNNGDGCSSSCFVETGWSCFGGSFNSPDICKDITSPSPILAYLSENNSGYLLALSYSEPVIFTTDISKSIEIEIKNTMNFNWSIIEKNSIFIITLTMHESISAGTTVKVIFKDPSSIADLSGNEMEVSSISIDLLESFTYKVGEAIKSSVTTATTITATSSVAGSLSAGFFLGSFNFQALWSMVEIMQIQNYLIFLSPKYPDNLISYLDALGIANGNILPNPFQLYLIKTDPFSDPPQKFIEQNYNTDFLMNSGQFILVWIIILLGFPVSLLLYKFWPRLSIIRTLKNSYFFSILLRTGIESFLEITLSVLLQLREFSRPNQDIGYLSLSLSVLTMSFLILTFALIVWQVTLKSKQILNMKLHQRQFGTLYEGFKTDSKLKSSFLIFQNSRRVLFVVLCVFLYDYPIAQMTLSAILSFTYALSLILLRPYKDSYLGNGLHICCEIFYFISHCLILKFLDDKISDDYRTNLGWAIIALLGSSLLLHIISILIIQAINLIQGIQQFKEWFMKNFANKFAKARKRVILLNNISLSEPSNYVTDINESMAYFEGKTPEKQNKDNIYSFKSTDVKTSDNNAESD